MWTLDRVRPYENNPRNNDKAVDAVAASIKEFGFSQPIVVDSDSVIIVGHTRLKAAQKLGLERVPVVVASHLTQEQVRAYRIADNKTAEIAEWNYDLLPIELSALQEANYDLGLLGFNAEELAKLMATGVSEGLTDPDEVPLPPDEAITQPGDLWILGNHRLLCGDSSKPEDLDRLLAGAPIHLVNTDPPYNVKVEPRSNNAIAAGLSSFTNDGASSRLKNGQGNAASFGVDHETGKPKNPATHKKLRAKDRPLANDFVSDEEFDRLLDAWFGNISRVLLPGHVAYVWGGYANCGNYPPYLKKHKLHFSQAIIWVKEWPVMTRKDFMGNHEWCFYSWREGAGHRYYGPNNATDTWSIKKLSSAKTVHLTEKPVELAVRAMQYSSLPGENVLDLFGGSGSTLIGAEQTGRNAYLMELDCLYADVIVDRYQRFSGKPAILERTGESPIPMGVREENMR
ncbi:MAG TPA: chromosome partitioning protein ParB [Planctomycetaceae bacterium]|nr:chromosome partitioning protein ParB [Planctomycetaceae bacterium]